MEPVPALMRVIVPGTRILFKPLPFLPSNKIAAVDAVDHAFVEMGALE
jgi:hypothetical protein